MPITRRLGFVCLLLLLPACRRSSPDVPTDAMPPSVGDVVGVAMLEVTTSNTSTAFDSQALVTDLSFSLLDSNVLDGDGVRVRQLTLEIQNDSERNLSNVTFYSLQTPNTVAGSNVSNMQDVLGNPIVDDAMAQSIIPVHGQSSVGVIDSALADMQAFSEGDQGRVNALLDNAYPDNDFAVLARGFVASNISGQADRAIAAGERGVVTIAVQYPFDVNNPAGYPDTFTLSFAFVDEPITRYTQGASESNEAFLDRLESLGGVTTGSEIVPADSDNPPNLSDVPTQNPNPNDEPTIITPAPFAPPMTQAPTTSNEPTDPAPRDSFTLGVANLLVSAEVEVDVSISPGVRRTLLWE